MFKKLVIYFCRKGYTTEKISKISRYSLFVYAFLLITIGLHYKVTFVPNLHISIGMNLSTWWILILLQNTTSIFSILFTRNISKYAEEYIEKILKEKSVIVGYKDNTFKVGTIYKIEQDDNLINQSNLIGLPRSIYGRLTSPKEGFFNGYYAGFQTVDREKIFKFISLQENRKKKLKKLKKSNLLWI